MIDRRTFLGLGLGAAAGLHLGSVPGISEEPARNALQGLADDPSLERRREYLEILKRVLRDTRPERGGSVGRVTHFADTWEEWVEKTGELPPDFESMPSRPFLPDPLVDGRTGGRIETREQWQTQRRWILEQYQQWFVGRMPPPPDNLVGREYHRQQDGGATVRFINLTFGPDRRASLRLELLMPEGKGPFPVWMTQHARGDQWNRVAFRRGYIACVVKAADPGVHAGNDAEGFLDVYPEHDMSGQGRWAWAFMRAIDYLVTLPEVDPNAICMGGNSRYGKATLVTTAFEDRIAAAAPSRGNCFGLIPWRYTTGMFSNEGLEEFTRVHPHWPHPRLRFFSGREDRLPVDQHMLASCIAPRGLIISQAFTEYQGNPWAVEQSYRSAKSVYDFLGAGENVALLQRPGEHGLRPEVIELYADFFDTVLGRKTFDRPEVIVNGYTWDSYLEQTASHSDPPAPDPSPGLEAALASAATWKEEKTRIVERLDWLLGSPPPDLSAPVETSVSVRATQSTRRNMVYPRTLFNRPVREDGMGSAGVDYGDRLRAEIYYPLMNKEIFRELRDDGPETAAESFPTVVWLHPYAYAIGYSRWADRIYSWLVERGFAVIGLDLIGCGTRVEEIKEFYRRYPGFSLMGRMVRDLQALATAIEGLPLVDNERTYIVGSGLGAKAALFTAAVEPRYRGVVSFAGFSSLRDPDPTTEGLRHYSHLHGTIPRLGNFLDRPEDVPVDYDELLALIAPRPTLVVAPQYDRYHPVDTVRTLTERARRAYELEGDGSALEVETPEGFNLFETEPRQTVRVSRWLLRQARRA